MNTSNFTSTGGLPNRYHFIGIGGIGMSALAQIAWQKGASVTGSDVAASYITEHLQKMGIKIYFEHAENNISQPTVIVYNSMIDEENPEIRAGKNRGYPVMHRSDLLHDLMRRDAALLVTGTHGKTTTSALLAHVLVEARMHPTFAVGGFIKSVGCNGRYDRGPFFVAEADESDGSFLKYNPFGAIITNIDGDHFDYWRTKKALKEGFRQFARGVSSAEHLFWCGDDDALRSLPLKGISYGFGEGNELRVLNFRQKGWKIFFDLLFDRNRYLNIELPLIGAHNVLNAAAVFGLALRLNMTPQKIRDAFDTFQGIGRRADFKGESHCIAAYDDYAHHPTEIYATLRAMKHAIDKRRLVVAFQPHRYTRTRDCFAEFGPAFSPADTVVLTDVYSAGESPIEGVNALSLLKKIQESSPVNIRYCERKDLSRYLCSILEKNDVLVTMGAGDITKCGPEVLSNLHEG
jgi:UDP-N-acetylmuramate--alanine ligase